MARLSDDDLLLVIADLQAQPNKPTGSDIYNKVCEMVGPSRWLKIAPEWRVSLSGLYPAFQRIQTAGWLRVERDPFYDWKLAAKSGKRLHRWRYHLTEAGWRRVEELRSRKTEIDQPFIRMVPA